MDQYIYASSDYSQSNDFRITFSEPLELDGEYVCALKELSYISSVYTLMNNKIIVKKNLGEFSLISSLVEETFKLETIAGLPYIECINNKIEIKVNGKSFELIPGMRLFLDSNKKFTVIKLTEYKFHKKYFTDIQELCKFLNQVKDVNFYSESGYLSIDFNIDVSVSWDPDLSKTLGFDTVEIFKSKTAPYKPQMQRNIKSIYIYCDAIDYSHVNNIKAPLLKIVPFESSSTFDRVTYTAYDPFYIKLTKKTISSIKFELRTSQGDLFPFLNNSQTTLTLHLKKL